MRSSDISLSKLTVRYIWEHLGTGGITLKHHTSTTIRVNVRQEVIQLRNGTPIRHIHIIHCLLVIRDPSDPHSGGVVHTVVDQRVDGVHDEGDDPEPDRRRRPLPGVE